MMSKQLKAFRICWKINISHFNSVEQTYFTIERIIKKKIKMQREMGHQLLKIFPILSFVWHNQTGRVHTYWPQSCDLDDKGDPFA